MVQISINDKSKEAQALLEYLKNLSFVKILENENTQNEKSPYNQEFVKKIKKAEKEKSKLMISAEKLWESL